MKPPVPSNIDLRDFAFMPVDVHRLLTSDTWILATGNERSAFMCLMLASWHQMPAGSLPGNDRMLAHLAMASDWPAVKEQALRGWELADDGRYYHKVVAEKAMEAWLEKLAQRLSSGSGNSSRWGIEFDAASIENAMDEARSALLVLNPSSRTLRKRRTAKRVKTSQGADPGSSGSGVDTASHDDPDGIPDVVPSGSNKHPGGNADAVPMLSQETGTGTGTSKAKDQEQSARGARPSVGRRTKITITEWLAELNDRQEDAVPDGDPIFAYAENADIPDEFLTLAWEVFRNAAIASKKGQKDWRQTFRNYVQNGYLKLWYFDSEGMCRLTTVGIQAQRQQRDAA